MSNEVVLSAALRSNLLSLQKTQSQIDKTQGVLSTGLKVSSALDNPQNFFASQALKDRSSDLTKLLDGIGQSIQTIKAADAGVTGLTKLVQQAQSIVDSARDAIGSGSKEAAITGTTDLSSITSNGATGGLTSVTGIANGAELSFQVKDKDGNAVDINAAGVVGIATGDSIDQLVSKINDLVNSVTGEAVLQASLTSAGKLSIKALDGGTFTVAFDADGGGSGNTGNTGVDGFSSTAATAANSAADQAFASALGFGSVAKQTEVISTTSGVQLYAVGVTALNNTKLSSGVFYREGAGNTGFARASDQLQAVVDTEAGTTERFTADSTSNITFTVNGQKTSAGIQIAGTTIQGLVDAVNNDTTIGSLVKASYDETTGKFSIEATSADVQTIKVTSNTVAGGALAKADFDFGTQLNNAAPATGTATGIAETYTLASAASTLAKYENDYNSVRDQIDSLVKDSGYRGVNLIAGDQLDTYFNEDRSNKLTTVGQTLDSDGLGLDKADFSRLDTIEATDTQARNALTSLRSFGGTLSNSLSIIQTRQDFTNSLIQTLDEGSDNLTVADQNEEGAKLLALQTRQQLGVTALSLAAQAQQSVLRLF